MRGSVSAGASKPAASSASASGRDRDRRAAVDRLVEEQACGRVEQERVAAGEDRVHDRRQLQTRVAQPQREDGEENRFGRPRDRETRSGQQVRGRDGRERERGDAEDEGECRLAHAEHAPGDRPDCRAAEQRQPEVAVGPVEERGEHERQAGRGEGERRRQRVEVFLARGELQPDARGEHR